MHKRSLFKSKHFKYSIIICAVVAVISIVVVVLYLRSINFFGASSPTSAMSLVDSEGRLLWVDTREKIDAQIWSHEVAYLWPWELETISEQYDYVFFEGREYGSAKIISTALLGESLGLCDAVGYDNYDEETEYQKECEAREIKGILPELMVAVKLDDNYYIYENNNYNPPETLGAFIDSYSLPSTLPLTEFTHYGKMSDSLGEYVVSQACSDEIWKMLETKRNATFYEWALQNQSDLTANEYLSFRAKSESLGTTNLAFYVTSSGYIWTNVCGWAYSFEIGKDTAEEIMEYALANATLAPPTPQSYHLTGTVVEIGDDYFKLDDSILMKNPEEGKVFTILTDDIRVKRYLIQDIVRVGSTVSVEYDGLIYAEEPDMVQGAFGLSEVFISCDDVAIPE